MNLNKNLIQLSGDASFRKFYRIKNKRSILVFSKKEKKIIYLFMMLLIDYL